MMARRVSNDSIEGAVYLEKYENARKPDNDQEMTRFLQSVSTQAVVGSPKANAPSGQLEVGYAYKHQGRVNDNSLSKVKNMFSTAAATGKGKAGLGYNEPTDIEDPEKASRKLSSKMTKIKKFFSKDDKDATTSMSASAEKVLAMLKSPNALPVNIPNLPELPKMVQSVSNANLSRNVAPRHVAYDDGQSDDGPRKLYKKKAIEGGKSGFEEKTMAYGSAEDTNRKKVAASDISGRSRNVVIAHEPVQHKVEQEAQSAEVSSHRTPIIHREQSKKPLYDDQGFWIGESDSEDPHDPHVGSRDVRSPRPQFEHRDVNDSEDDDVEEGSSPALRRMASNDTVVVNSLAIAHYTPSIQQFIARPEQATRDYARAIQLAKAQQEAKARRLAEAKAKEKADIEGGQDSSPQGAIPSVPSFQELKRQEAEEGKGPEQLHKDRQVGVKHWLGSPRLDSRPESPDSPRQVHYGPRQPRTKLESKERKISSSSTSRERSISRDAQRVRQHFGLPPASTESGGSKRVEILSTIEEDDLEANFQSPGFPKLYHPTPTRTVRIRPSAYEGLSSARKEPETSASPQRDTAEPPSSPFDRDPRDHVQEYSRPVKTISPPSTPKAQIVRRQLSAAEEIERINKHIVDAYDGKCEYNDYEAPSDITVGLSPVTLLQMFPRPLHIIKNPKKTRGNAHSPTPASKGPRGGQALEGLQGRRPLPVAQRYTQPQQPQQSQQPGLSELQPPQHNATGEGAWDERFRDDSNEVSSGHKALIIEGMGKVMTEVLDRMEKMEERMEGLKGYVDNLEDRTERVEDLLEEVDGGLVRMRRTVAKMLGIDTSWPPNGQNLEGDEEGKEGKEGKEGEKGEKGEKGEENEEE
ncbi:uncharacterized protein F4807DRAFT_186068 [Annulohypoxylon truncatum]|uniref:uncharacterized protein n=1 Tax=Annulohypoxylon truncatum TaxID=327061 RepID=UPI0020088508|nr:uncharacterized protein F4807DRAFT_186068 [Annulohypoxylon truncatum]KAI1207356.1 hypothetical protein F4807DRAFT_186068 [Annulohypoxylon truncatum]